MKWVLWHSFDRCAAYSIESISGSVVLNSFHFHLLLETYAHFPLLLYSFSYISLYHIWWWRLFLFQKNRFLRIGTGFLLVCRNPQSILSRPHFQRCHYLQRMHLAVIFKENGNLAIVIEFFFLPVKAVHHILCQTLAIAWISIRPLEGQSFLQKLMVLWQQQFQEQQLLLLSTLPYLSAHSLCQTNSKILSFEEPMGPCWVPDSWPLGSEYAIS